MGWFITAVILLLVVVVLFIIGSSGAREAKKITKEVEAKRAENKAARAEELAAGKRSDSYSRYGNDPYATDERTKDIDNAKSVAAVFRVGGIVLSFVVALFLAFSMIYPQSVGQAKVIVNLDGTIAGEDLSSGFGIKAPWQKFSEWDLFSQEATFAGNGEGTPDYTGGTVTGYEVTSAVARGAQTNFDLSVVYSLDAENVTPLYRQYRDQERFTKQVVERTILSVARDIPPAYTPVEFRGDKRGEATEAMTAALNKSLNKYGINDIVVNLQNIRYTDEVEESIKQVEVAQQKEETAQAELRATTVSAQAKVVEAQAEADANAILTASLSPEVLQQRALDALVKIGNKGNTVIVPEGFGGILQLK